VATDEEVDRVVRRLHGEVDRLEHDLDRVWSRVVVWPVLAVTILMLFWPTFDAVGETEFDPFAGDVEYQADGGPVTVTGLWRAVSDRDMAALTYLALATVVLHLVVVVCLAALVDTKSKRLPLVTQVAAGLLGTFYLIVVIGVRQDDGVGAFGGEGYQPNAAWLLMAATVVAVVCAAQWVRDQPG
jgi:hypothetical protein